MVYEIELDFKISGCEDCPYHKNGQVETLGLSFCCDLSQKYMLIPNEEMNDYHNHKRPKDCPVKGDNGWHYIEDGDYPPLDHTVLAINKTSLGLSAHLNERVQRTGWGRTIECWNRDVDNIIAWHGPIPDFTERKVGEKEE